MYQVIPETRTLFIVALSMMSDGSAVECRIINGDIIGWRVYAESKTLPPTPVIPAPLIGWKYIGYVKDTPVGVTPCIITEYGHFESMDDLRSELRFRGILPPLSNDPPVV